MESERFLLNKIRQHLKENYNLITEFKLGTGSNRLIPDAVIYRNEEPIAFIPNSTEIYVPWENARQYLSNCVPLYYQTW